MILTARQLNYAFLSIWVLYLFFLIINTGIIGDDYSVPYFENHLHVIIGPVNYLVREGFYRFIESRDYIVIDIIKFIVVLASTYGCYKFFNLFHGKYFSIIFAFAFVFYPLHDTVTYWFTAQGYLICCALYFYAYVLLSKKNYRGAVFFALLASFMGYGSPPFAAGLGYLAYRQYGYRSSLLIFLPNVFYVIYYVAVTKIFGVGIDRVSENFYIVPLLKNFFLQMSTAIDAHIGPSAWFKIYYAMSELSFISFCVAVFVSFIAIRQIKFVGAKSVAINTDVAVSFLIIMLVSWLMFASTGLYPQTSFNLGNRVTFWGALLFVYMLMSLASKNNFSYFLIVTTLVFSITGISQHWKSWHLTQKTIVYNIQKNHDIKAIDNSELIFVKGHGYSRLGLFSHLEFFSIESYASSIFRHSLGRSHAPRVIYIGDNLSVGDDFAVRRKEELLVSAGELVNLYDAEEDKFYRMKPSDFALLLGDRLKDHRHWIQIYGCGSTISFIELIAPRYAYLCKKTN